MEEDVSNQTGAGSRRIKTVRDQTAIDLLINVRTARLLEPVMRGEHSLGSAAAALQRPASSVAYWVARFKKAGLLVVVRTQTRAGKPIPIYRAAADEFRVPFDAMPAGSTEEFLHNARRTMLAEYAAAVDHADRRYFSQGIRISGHPEKGIHISFIEPTDEGRSPVTEWWGKISLTPSAAVELQNELEALAERYSQKAAGTGASNYLMMMGLTPVGR